MMFRSAVVLGSLIACSNLFAVDTGKPSPEAVEQFEKVVRPILAEHCYECHGEKKQSGGIRFDTADNIRKGVEGTPIVIPGDPAKSSLIQSVNRLGDSPMPPKKEKALSKESVAILEAWVKAGAIYPESAKVALDPNAFKKHWAYQPITKPAVPAGATSEIDRFILQKLTAKKIAPAPLADKRTLARRLSYDLLGLPPTAEELDAFEKDSDPKAYEKLIDKYLASPHYGERWGRYWLDVARYADTKGYVFNESRAYPYAYTYRDYVIRSLNDDKPIDQFLVEQLAADKLPNLPKADLAAMGFITVGRRFSNNTHDIIDDRIDLVTRGLMGITVACARCHDHKYDPIPAADYYSLYGVFASSNEPKDLPLIGEVPDTKEYREFQTQVEKMTKGINDYRDGQIARRLQELQSLTGSAAIVLNTEKLINRADKNEIVKLQNALVKFQQDSAFNPPRAMVMNDNPKATEPVVFLRGNPGTRGPQIPRRMPEVVVGKVRAPFKEGSGRLELAKAIVDPANPLTARVFVNRVWTWHFGQGLVRTPSDFGVRTEAPSHPELLDWLASTFVGEGWSMKKLHKRILLSDAYQRSTASTPAMLQLDPENLLLAHQNRRRLDFEATRDSFLAASGQLDRTVGGKSVDLFKAPYSPRRAVYAFVDRQNLPGTFRAFDFASPEQHTPLRFQTTVPQQALYLMNNPFAVERARGVLKRADVANATTPAEKVKAIYRAVLARVPTTEESALALDFQADAAKVKPQLGHLDSWEQLAQVLLLSNEFLFVD